MGGKEERKTKLKKGERVERKKERKHTADGSSHLLDPGGRKREEGPSSPPAWRRREKGEGKEFREGEETEGEKGRKGEELRAPSSFIRGKKEKKRGKRKSSSMCIPLAIRKGKGRKG